MTFLVVCDKGSYRGSFLVIFPCIYLLFLNHWTLSCKRGIMVFYLYIL
jgi:hypothetical protein